MEPSNFIVDVFYRDFDGTYRTKSYKFALLDTVETITKFLKKDQAEIWNNRVECQFKGDKMTPAQGTKTIGSIIKDARYATDNELKDLLDIGSVYGFDWDVYQDRMWSGAKQIKVLGFVRIQHNQCVQPAYFVAGVEVGKPEYDFTTYHPSRFTTETITQIKTRLLKADQAKFDKERVNERINNLKRELYALEKEIEKKDK